MVSSDYERLLLVTSHIEIGHTVEFHLSTLLIKGLGIGNGTTLLEKSLRAVRQRVQADRFVIIGQYDLALRRQDSEHRTDSYEQCQASRYAPSEGSLPAIASSGPTDLYAIANLTDSIVESLRSSAVASHPNGKHLLKPKIIRAILLAFCYPFFYLRSLRKVTSRYIIYDV